MKKNGGPAFPVHPGVALEEFKGMSLRDWFAGTIDVPIELATVYAAQTNGIALLADVPIRLILAARARLRFDEADAMLAERDK